MKIIVLDLDRIKYRKPKKISRKFRKESLMMERIKKMVFKEILEKINDNKICHLLPRDFGKKTLMKLPNNDPNCLKAARNYREAIFKLKDDDYELLHENRMFKKILPRISWFRIGVILRREKAVKILLKLLGQ